MPAISPERLKKQSAALVEHFSNPPTFVRDLQILLEFYADRTHRSGQAGKPYPLIQAYKVRPPLLKQILIDLAPLAEKNPDTALILCDSLWDQPYLEFHQLCASLLGIIPAETPQKILSRIQNWIQKDTEDTLIDDLLSEGLSYLRRENFESVHNFIEALISSNDPFQLRIGIRALLPIIKDPNIENIPVIFRLIQPFTRVLPSQIYPELSDIIQVLARRSPRETAYFLRQMLSIPNSPDTPWLIRQVIQSFPRDYQIELREAARSAKYEISELDQENE